VVKKYEEITTPACLEKTAWCPLEGTIGVIRFQLPGIISYDG